MVVDAVDVELPVSVRAAASVAFLRGCQAGLGRGRCVLHRARAGRFRARVIRTDSGLSIEVSLEGELIESRNLRFGPRDAVLGRWEAAGLVVAAMVTARVERRAVVAPTPKSTARYRLEALALVAPGLNLGPPRVGAQLSALGTPFEALWFLVSVRFARTVGGDVSATWTDLALGASYRYALGRFYLEPHGAVVGQHVQLAATLQGNDDSGDRLRAGLRGGLQVGYAFSSSVYIFAGVDLDWLAPSLAIDVAGDRLNSESSLRWAGALGLGFQL